MPVTISRIIQAMEPSATMAMATKAKELKASGQTVYDFSLGEPDFNTPEHICQAAIEAMKAGHTHYTQASGIPELKSAVAKRYSEDHGLEYAPQQGDRLEWREAFHSQRPDGSLRRGRRGHHSGTPTG